MNIQDCIHGWEAYKGVNIYNKKVWWSPLNGSIPFVDTGFDIHNIYNLMAVIKIKKWQTQ